MIGAFSTHYAIFTQGYDNLQDKELPLPGLIYALIMLRSSETT